MVSLKVTFKGETRRTQLPNTATYSELLQTITSLFPSLSEGQELSLVYRDEEGDIVSVSSDQEVATAISLLPTDGVWRINARTKRNNNGPHPLLTLLETIANSISQQPSSEEKGKEKREEGEEKEKTEGETEGQEGTPEDKNEGDKEEEVKSKPKTPPLSNWGDMYIHLMTPTHPLFITRPHPFLYRTNCCVF